MIQDIFPHKLENSWSRRKEITASSPVFVINGRSLLVKRNAVSAEYPYSIPAYADLTGPELGVFFKDAQFLYLFLIDEEPYFLAFFKTIGDMTGLAGAIGIGDNEAAGTDCRALKNYCFADMSALREKGQLPKPVLFAVLTGKHLETWYGNTRFCGKCGGTMGHSVNERAMICEKCGNTVYPRLMPAVIVGVKNGDKLLLTRYNRGYRHNALIAGFVEIGETLEETVAREVMEEAGVKVKNITYYKSQPWGIASDILTGFYCEVDGDDTIRVDRSELKSAAWVERSEIELQPDDNSLTNEMMKKFKNGEIL